MTTLPPDFQPLPSPAPSATAAQAPPTQPDPTPGSTLFAAAWLVNAIGLFLQVGTVVLFFVAVHSALTASDIESDAFFAMVACALVTPVFVLIGIGLTTLSAARHYRHRPTWTVALIVFTVACALPAATVAGFLLLRNVPL